MFQPPSTSTDLRSFFQPITSDTKIQFKDLSNLINNDGKKPLQTSPSSSESKANTDDRLKIPTFWEIVRDDRTPSALKEFAVKRNVPSWQEKYVAKTLSKDDESAILGSVNGVTSISKLLSDSRLYDKPMIPAIAEFNWRNQPFDPSHAAKLTKRLALVRKMQNLNENQEVSSKERISQMNDSSMLDVSAEQSQTFSTLYQPIESKYEQPKSSKETSLFAWNTPVRKQTPLRSSTPKKKSNKSTSNIKDSPLIRAFERCKSLNVRKKKPSKKIDGLAFLGLKDAMDIFDDGADGVIADDIAKASVDSTKVDCPDHSRVVHYENSNASCIKAPSILTNPESQEYTVSQILKIVNVIEDACRETPVKKNVSVKEKMSTSSENKEIFIGTIEDIFGCDDNIDIDNLPISNKQSVSEEDDVIASSQSVIYEPKLLSKFESNSAKNNKSILTKIS